MHTNGIIARVIHGYHQSTETSLTHHMALSASSMIGNVYAACGAWSWNKWLHVTARWETEACCKEEEMTRKE